MCPSRERIPAATPLILMVRGINVAGSRPLRMEQLKGLVEGLGYARARTYLQSGNVVCAGAGTEAWTCAEAVERRILRDFGYEVGVAAVTGRGMAAVVASNPLVGRQGIDPNFLHATFLIRPGRGVSLEGLALPLGKGEAAVLVGEVLYLHCPNGYGVTKLNNTFFERKLGCRATTRNWRTVTALEAMAREAPHP